MRKKALRGLKKPVPLEINISSNHLMLKKKLNRPKSKIVKKTVEVPKEFLI